MFVQWKVTNTPAREPRDEPNLLPAMPRLRPTRRAVVGTVATVLAIGVAALIGNSIGSTEPVADGSGTLTVDGVVYQFTPTTCLISDEDFVAAGTGFDDGERFWVSASSKSLDLAVGTESEVEQPAGDQLWLISDQDIDWEATGDTVTAMAPMVDRRAPRSTTMLGSLELRCDRNDF